MSVTPKVSGGASPQHYPPGLRQAVLTQVAHHGYEPLLFSNLPTILSKIC